MATSSLPSFAGISATRAAWRRSFTVPYFHCGWVYLISVPARSLFQAHAIVSAAFPGARFVWVGSSVPGPAQCL